MSTKNGLHPAIERAWANSLMESLPVSSEMSTVKGYDFNEGVQYDKIFKTLHTIGFQATHLGRAIEAINNMLDCRFSPVPKVDKTSLHKTHITKDRKTTNCTIMLGYTSNMVTSGNREVIRYLVEHNMVDCIVTTTGGIEEDFIKCLHSFHIGDFSLQGADLHCKHHNRSGNLIVPNSAYRKFHAWLNPILNTMLEEQNNGTSWTPSKIIRRMGQEINNIDSIYYWAYRNKIPVFCPALTDGAMGDVLYYHRHTHHDNSLRIDIVEDLQMIDDIAVFSVNTGVLTLGAGLIKHHIMNANCIRQGSDFAVYINTSPEFDGSDAGASPDEAVSWGKIKKTCNPVKIFADATIVFPVLVGETFAKRESEIITFNKRQLES